MIKKMISAVCAAALAVTMLPAVALAAENSWRYSNGQLKDSSQIDTDSSGEDFSAYGVVDKYYFDNYYLFNKGYCSGMNASRGIDVSEHNKSINWNSVKAASIDFAIIRCGYGDNDRNQDDKYFIQNIHGCQQNGIPFGVYLYSYAKTTAQAKSEAEHVLHQLRSAGIDYLRLPVYYDMEDSSTTSADHAALATMFCNTIEDAGYKAGVYANLTWWTKYLTNSCFNQWYKWIAQYNVSQGLTYAPASNFENSDMVWQFTSRGKIAGISGYVDLNYSYMPGLTRSNNGSLALSYTGNGAALNTAVTAMHRLYNPNSGEHFYTASTSESQSLQGSGWKYEGVAWNAPASGEAVYRLYNANAGDHHYTTSASERDSLVQSGWKSEGIGWYSATSKNTALFRLYNPNAWTGTHHYTTSKSEAESLMALGWKYEGISWYGR